MDGKRVAIWVRNASLVGVIAAFILFFGLPMGQSSPDVVAEVDGEPIRRDVFVFYRSAISRAFGDLDVPGVQGAQLTELIDRQTYDALLRRHVLAAEARRLGLRVTDAEVRAEILADPQFRNEAGRFDRERFEKFVALNDLGSERVYTDELRRDLLLRKFERTIRSPVRTSGRELRQDVTRSLTTIRLSYAAARLARFAGKPPSEAEVRAFAQNERPRLEAAYQARLDEFRKPETVRARHILMRGAEARPRAEQALARIRGGESFESVARELSEDEATREQGGALGSFPRGRMVPEFEQAAFSASAGEIVGPVESSYGQHVILVEERTPPLERTLDEVAIELAKEMLAGDRSRARAREAAEQAATRIRAGAALKDAARAAGLELAETAPFKLTDPEVPGLAGVERLREVAVGLGPDAPATAEVFEGPEGYFLIALAERQEPKSDEIELEIGRARDRMEQNARGELSDRWYRSRREALEREGRITLYDRSRSG
jgi:parvulin-like peptidyl-prolyl isomerase